MVAIVFPPNAGRVIKSCLCFCSSSLPGIGFNGKSPISNTVQSAVSPVFTLADTRGPRSRPIAVAPTSMISGLYSLITDANACVYGSVRYSFSSGSSTTMTLSAPYSANWSARSFTPEPINTAVTSVSKSFAKSFALPSSSKAIPLNTLSTCCAKTYTPLYASKPIIFTTFLIFTDILDYVFLFQFTCNIGNCIFRCIGNNFFSGTFLYFIRCFCNLGR